MDKITSTSLLANLDLTCYVLVLLYTRYSKAYVPPEQRLVVNKVVNVMIEGADRMVKHSLQKWLEWVARN